ncbi:hypothetical protein AM493_17835 [Flavobacterium akiainvivens]|uniref:CAAX prenyl protease 2/Lysostaphin resistance protein A-like domain-containing protein n=1 Tax=Flavobacterium akiainvivens TaxID=1202724 RepID=A0A0M8MKH2_9FLAO|nr:CPBP family intramembrane glutamic endopeptidase [Flavobacterium akiainvivens]KOS07697.1 hypothetical protein AM493_17835 [Flavobacterium akiainvivens]SFQ24476.1 CAAX protease self-immunity [Flavobacterium akiainvivens]
MNLPKKLVRLLLFYVLALVLTYIARKQVNVLNLLLQNISDIPFSFNYNHGIAVALLAFLFYRFGGIAQSITLLGSEKLKSLLFPLVLFTVYGVVGINNAHGINPHLWALLFCFLAFVYNIMEEYAWRGWVIDALGNVHYVVKSMVSGVLWAFWHLLIFADFNQYGGFWVFMAFCVVFSFILTFAALRTKSVVAPAAIHAFIIQTNIAAVVCFVLFALLLVFWPKIGNIVKTKKPAV